MPRGRGGARQGQPGKSYPNRTDLNAQPVRTAPGQTYGKAGQQAAAQRSVPLPQQQAPTARTLQAAVPIDAPSARPDEPVTHGITGGPGAGPEALNLPQGGDQVLNALRGLYRAFPNEDLRRLIAEAELG